MDKKCEILSMGAKVNPNICPICGGSDCAHLRYTGFGKPVKLERPINQSILNAKGFSVIIDGKLQDGIESVEISNHGTILAAVIEIYNPNEDNDKIKTLVTDARLNDQGSLDLHLITFNEGR